MVGVCSKCGKMFETTEEDAYTPGTMCPQCHKTQRDYETTLDYHVREQVRQARERGFED